MNRVMLSIFALTFGAAACGNEPATSDTPEQLGTTSSALAVSHAVWSGASANAFFGNELAGGYGDVTENTSGTTRSAWLSYYRWAVDPTSQVCWTETYPGKPGGGPGGSYTYCDYSRRTSEYGWGQIPAADFGAKNGTARLDTTVANGPNFFIETCAVDYVAGSYLCSNAGGGAIALTFTKNGRATAFHNGVDENTFGKYMWRTTGQYRGASADAAGTIFGVSVVGNGSVSTSRGASVSKDIVIAPPPPPFPPPAP